MTNEDAKAILLEIKNGALWKLNIQIAFDKAIKALEQDAALDKIRAEIENVAFDWQEIDGEHESFMVVDLNDVLNIIDKYKAGGK